MADQIVYVFNDNSLPYVCDNGIAVDWVGRVNIWAGLTATEMATIVAPTGADVFTLDDSPKFVKDLDESIFDPRKIKVSFTDPQGINGKIEIILPNNTDSLANAEEISGAIEALGATVNRVDLIGEKWRDIYDLVAPPTKAIATGARFNARRRYNRRLSYISSSIGGGIAYTERVSMQSDSNGAIPTGLATPLATAQTLTNKSYSNETGRPDPRHYVVTTMFSDGTLDRKQQTKVKVSSNAPAAIFDVGTLLGALPSSNRLSYKGEDIEKLERFF